MKVAEATRLVSVTINTRCAVFTMQHCKCPEEHVPVALPSQVQQKQH